MDTLCLRGFIESFHLLVEDSDGDDAIPSAMQLIAGRLAQHYNQRKKRKGAATQAVMMSVYQTLKLRGLNPLKTIVSALTQYMKTGELPPLPDKSVACQ